MSEAFVRARALGLAARQRGSRALAAQHYREASTLAPDDVGVAMDLFHVLRELGRLDEAEAVCRGLTQTHPERGEGWRGLALAARQRRNRAQSLERWRKAQECEPDDSEVALEIASDLRALGRPDEAEAVFLGLTQTHPHHWQGWWGLALAARQRGDKARSLECWRKTQERQPDNPGIAFEIANDLRDLGRLDEAEQVLRELTQTRPQHLEGWRALALTTRQRGNRAQSLESWRKAQACEPDNPGIAFEIASDLRDLGRLDDAEEVCRELTQTHPQSALGWRGLAMAARQRGSLAQALEFRRKAQACEPDNPGIAFEIANDLRDLGRLDEAEEACRELTQTHPQSALGWRGLAMAARQRGSLAQALEFRRKAQACEPDNPGIAFEIANDLRDLGRLDDAEEACRELTQTHPQSALGWRGLAMAARQRGSLAQALEFRRKAQACEPDNASIAFEIANDLRDLGRRDEAEEVAAANREANPRSALAWIGYVNAIRHKASNPEVIGLLEQAVALEPGHLGARMALAGEYLACWRLEDAEAQYDQALAQNENSVAALTGKAQICRRRGDRRRALALCAKAAEIDRDSQHATLEYGRELVDSGCVDEGLALLRDAVERRKDWSQCLVFIAQIERERGNYAAARQSLEAACRANPIKDHAWIELANDDFRLGAIKAATDALQKAIAERPSFTRPLETLANFAQTVDDLEGALTLLLRVQEINAAQPNILISIARLQARLGLLDESRASLEKVGRDFGALPNAEAAKAALLRERGDLVAAQQVLERAVAAFPAEFAVWCDLVSLRIIAGQFAAAEEMLHDAPAATARERGRVLFLRGQLAKTQWRWEEAAALFEQALEFLPTDPSVHRQAACCALLSVDVDGALRRLNVATEFNPSHRALHNGSVKPMQTYEGQLIDEYRIDASALSRLQAASQSPNCIEDLAALVVDAPDYTPAALGLMTALRRRGRLDGAAGGERAASRIPRKIAQFWDRDVPEDVQEICATWPARHPDFAYKLFSSSTARRFLVEKGAVDALAAFDRASEAAMKADVFRLAYLFFEGGFYVDADDLCLARLEELDCDGRQLLLYQEEYGSVGNNFIGVTPEHPVIGRALAEAVDALNRGDSDVVWLATGPGLLTRALARFLAEDMSERLPTVRVWDRHELTRAIAIHCMTSYKYTRKHWSRTLHNHNQTAGVVRAAVRACAASGL